MSATHTIANDNVAMQNIRSLKTIRKEKGLTQAQLGKIIWKSADVIRRIENGERLPSVEDYNELARFFKWERYNSNRKENNSSISENIELKTQSETLKQEEIRSVKNISAELANDLQAFTDITSELSNKIINVVSELFDIVQALANCQPHNFSSLKLQAAEFINKLLEE